MQEIITQMAAAGLNKNCSHVYFATLGSQGLTPTEIARETRLKRVSIYKALGELLELDLIEIKNKGKTKKYLAKNPKKILSIAERHFNNLESSMPALSVLYEKNNHRPRIEIHSGINAVSELYKQAFSHIHQRKEVLWSSNLNALIEKFPEILSIYKKYLNELDHANMRELILDTQVEDRYYKKIQKELRRKIKKHRVKILSSPSPFGATEILFFDNKVALISLDREIYVTYIHSKGIFHTFKALYEVLWFQAKSIS